MSYGIIRAWKSASEYERVEQFLHAIIESDKEYLLENCAADIEFVDVVANQTLNGVEQLEDHLKAIWNLPKGSFEIANIEMTYADKSETASFVLNTDHRQAVGLLVVEESNGRISHCKLALSKPE
ncbi:MAG: hypothetical protein RL266_579 [Bacteroidota bacterium]